MGGTLTASRNDEALVALKIAPTFQDNAKTAVKHYGLIVADGNVGIGTTALNNKLDVRGGVFVQQLAFADGTGTGYPDNWLGMTDNISGTTKWLHIGGITDGDGTKRKRRLALYADTTFVSGNVGIGTTDPGDLKLKVQGNAYITGTLWANTLVHYWSAGNLGWVSLDNRGASNLTGNAQASGPPSDLRFKTDLRPISNALEKVLQLQGTCYRWGETGLKYFTRNIANALSAGPDATEEENHKLWEGERRKAYESLSGENIGLVAQDVETIVPEVVHEDEAGYKYIRYQQMVALLVEAIKEQNALIQALSAKVAAL